MPHPLRTKAQRRAFERIALSLPPNAQAKTLRYLMHKRLIVRGADKRKNKKIIPTYFLTEAAKLLC